jgi:hypothetical protein
MRYQEFLDEQDAVFQDKNATIDDILKFSKWGTNLGVWELENLNKFTTVIEQLTWLEKQIKKTDNWPIIWRIAALNPYNTEAQVLATQLTALIPWIARWVYGEVWVLTDNDIRLYSQTIPNLTQTDDVQKAVLALTLDTVAWWYKRQLSFLWASGRDVSLYVSLYNNFKWQADSIRAELWITDTLAPAPNNDVYGMLTSDNDVLNFALEWVNIKE